MSNAIYETIPKSIAAAGLAPEDLPERDTENENIYQFWLRVGQSYRDENPILAAKIYEHLADIEPDDTQKPKFLMYAANAYKTGGDYAGAAEAFDQVAAMRVNKNKKASSLIDAAECRAMSLAEDNSERTQELLRLGENYEKDRNWWAAAKAFYKLSKVETETDKKSQFIMLAVRYYEYVKEWGKSGELLRELAGYQSDPQDKAITYRYTARNLEMAGRLAGSAEMYFALVEVEPDENNKIRAALSAAKLYRTAEEWPLAGKAFLTAARYQREPGEQRLLTLNNANHAYERCEDMPNLAEILLQAVLDFREIGRLWHGTEDAGVSLRYAETLCQRAVRLPDAPATFKQAAKDWERDEDKAELWITLGYFYEGQGNSLDAMKAFKQAVRIEMLLNNTVASTRLGVILLYLGDSVEKCEKPGEAAEVFEMAVSYLQSTNNRSSALARAAGCRAQMGDPASAKKLFDRAMSVAGDNSQRSAVNTIRGKYPQLDRDHAIAASRGHLL